MENVRIADCCAAENHQFMRIGERWFLVVFLPIAVKGDQTTWKSASFPAVSCHSCGIKLEDAPSRRYFRGAFAPVDSLVEKLETP